MGNGNYASSNGDAMKRWAPIAQLVTGFVSICLVPFLVWVVAEIQDIKASLLSLRRAVWPHRDALRVLLNDELELVEQRTTLYLRDCFDHAVQVIELVEMYRGFEPKGAFQGLPPHSEKLICEWLDGLLANHATFFVAEVEGYVGVSRVSRK